MGRLKDLAGRILPFFPAPEVAGQEDAQRYRRLWRFVVLLTAAVSLTPILILTSINYHQFEDSLREGTRQQIHRLLGNTRRSLESFLRRHRDALKFVVLDRSAAELLDPQEIRALHGRLNSAWGGFVDLGVIDSNGTILEYFGPYGLKGKSYLEQDWFPEVLKRGTYTSDVFMGFREFPHFVIAVRGEDESGEPFVLRATIDADILTRHIAPLKIKPSNDAFVVNRAGVLQTPSHDRKILEHCGRSIPGGGSTTEVREVEEPEFGRVFVGSTAVPDSPFIFVMISSPSAGTKSYLDLRAELLGLTITSMILILLLVAATSTYFVYRIRESDIQRVKTLHNIEYTSKMASIGRLAAGVAHEINNPLAIINEKAGLMKDLVGIAEEMPHQAKFGALLDSILRSVDRCRTITHRLLGFAKRMDIQPDEIRLDELLGEVISFTEKEARLRGIRIDMTSPEDLPPIESDRGQLQQAFLNILNNAIEAVSDGGRVEVALERGPDGGVSARITDDGCGISRKDREHIFEPFFTTKTGYGTGLGLSITYGIVTKLGGKIEVQSELGEGTSFTVILPPQAPIGGAS